jgi:sulfonate transport system substrate-binding protein
MLGLGCVSLLLVIAGGPAWAGEVLRLDFAYYNPVSLILKDRGWVEAAVGPDVQVQWVQSAGSNKALEFLRGRALDFGSTAGSAALLGRANGTPVKAIYVYGQMEWTALVTRADSPIRTVADLRGKRVAATPGTDPGIFLLRALDGAGLTRADITLVPLQHQDGRLALDRGDVDAWAGLDPFMALAEAQSRDRLFFRDRALVTPGTLLVREAYAGAHPERVAQVLAAYERGRAWALANPDGLADVLVKATKLPPEVAALQLQRTDLSTAAIGPAQRASIVAAARVLKGSGSVAKGADLDRAAAELIDTGFTDKLRP